MIEIRVAEAAGATDRDTLGGDIFNERFLIERPILQAMRPHPEGPPVLLIDELDRADEPFEAFLLEALSEFQVTVPEIGPIKAAAPPLVIITSNRTREIHDALKRRCFYHWVDFPTAARELQILALKAPDANEDLSRQIVTFVHRLRAMDMFKQPGVAETIDWANALMQLNAIALEADTVSNTLGVLLKYQDDIQKLQGGEAKRILDEVRQELAAAD
jgi:MoxR-like ATPase